MAAKDVQSLLRITPKVYRRPLGREALQAVRKARDELARDFQPEELAVMAFSLYERFRPAIPEGVGGWGAKGELDLSAIRSLANKGAG